MIETNDMAGLQEDLNWVSETYNEATRKRCAQLLEENPELRDACDIGELAWNVAAQDAGPEICYDPVCASRPPVPRRTFREWIRDLFQWSP